MVESKWGQARSAARGIHSVVADVDPRQHDFLVAVIDQSPDFVFNVFGRTAAQARSNLWNDAVGAFQDAPILNACVLQTG